MNNNDKNKKRKAIKRVRTSKQKAHDRRNSLYFINISAFVILCILAFLEFATGYTCTPMKLIVKYAILMCVFTFGSLVIYFLSIIAEALGADTDDIEGYDDEPPTLPSKRKINKEKTTEKNSSTNATNSDDTINTTDITDTTENTK